MENFSAANLSAEAHFIDPTVDDFINFMEEDLPNDSTIQSLNCEAPSTKATADSNPPRKLSTTFISGDASASESSQPTSEGDDENDLVRRCQATARTLASHSGGNAKKDGKLSPRSHRRKKFDIHTTTPEESAELQREFLALQAESLRKLPLNEAKRKEEERLEKTRRLEESSEKRATGGPLSDTTITEPRPAVSVKPNAGLDSEQGPQRQITDGQANSSGDGPAAVGPHRQQRNSWDDFAGKLTKEDLRGVVEELNNYESWDPEIRRRVFGK